MAVPDSNMKWLDGDPVACKHRRRQAVGEREDRQTDGQKIGLISAAFLLTSVRRRGRGTGKAEE